MVDPVTPEETPEEAPWWQDEGLPWKKKPERADYAILIWFAVISIFSLILLPLRAYFIASAPDILAMISGSRSATAASGAWAGVGRMEHWPWVLLISSVMSVKFDWVYWWAGLRWGRGMIEVWAGQSKRAAKNYDRAERWAERLGPLGFFVAYIPIPLPLMQVVFVLAGATKMSLTRFLIYDYIASTLWLVGYFVLGWQLGEPVVAVLDSYAKFAGYVAIGLIVVIIISTFVKAKAKQDG